MSGKIHIPTWADFPPDFPYFFLDPTGCVLSIREIGKNTYALVSNIMNVDNAGFVVGEKGVLVVDAHISVPMAKQILQRVREVTDKPILYLVNSNYHADHTFGNCAFPAETLVVQHRETAARTPFHQEARDFLFRCTGNNPRIWDDVTLRLPDIVFEDHMTIDLGGGMVVELHWFGPANTPGDTITYVPHARAAWTGNMTGGGTFGLAIETDAPTFMGTLSRFIRALDVETLIPAHSPLSGPETLWSGIHYYAQVTGAVNQALGAGWSLEETLERSPLGEAFLLAPDDTRVKLQQARHRYNVRRTYLSLTGRV
jgi:cyclase